MHDGHLIRQFSEQDFLALGLSDLAYIKTVELDDRTGYAVYSADGQELAILPSREAAEVVIRRHDREPVSVH